MIFLFVFLWKMGIEPVTSCMLVRCFVTELSPPARIILLWMKCQFHKGLLSVQFISNPNRPQVLCKALSRLTEWILLPLFCTCHSLNPVLLLVVPLGLSPLPSTSSCPFYDCVPITLGNSYSCLRYLFFWALARWHSNNILLPLLSPPGLFVLWFLRLAFLHPIHGLCCSGKGFFWDENSWQRKAEKGLSPVLIEKEWLWDLRAHGSFPACQDPTVYYGFACRLYADPSITVAPLHTELMVFPGLATAWKSSFAW